MESGTQLSVVLDFPKQNTLNSGQKVSCFATFFAGFTLVRCCKQDILEYFYSLQAFSLFKLDSFFGVTTMLIHPQLSPITAIKLCDCFKVTIDVMFVVVL
jgi:hypothetical protein